MEACRNLVNAEPERFSPTESEDQMIKTMADIKREFPTMEKLTEHVIGQLSKNDKQVCALKMLIETTYNYSSLLEYAFLHLNK